ncbi:MAG: hypothetical protein SF029_14240 [bacterium]|nr:hypothetical protein [bacterium]
MNTSSLLRPALIALLIAFVGLCGAAATSAQTPPPNDDFNNAVVVGALPFTHTQSTTSATRAGDDPNPGCTFAGLKTVWFRYTPATSGVVRFSTQGSNFDTIITLWSGTRGSLTEIACNDDFNSVSSQIETYLSGGATYYLLVHGYTSAGGDLTLNVTSVGSVPSLALSEPTGTISEGAPTYRWTISGVSTYSLAIFRQDDMNTPYYLNQNISANDYCPAGTCNFNPVNAPLLNDEARLYNGVHLAYLCGGVCDDLAAWSGPFIFTVSALPPAPISGFNVIDLNTPRPTLRWTTDALATSFRVYIAPVEAFFTAPVIDIILWRRVACPSGNVCSYPIPLDLQDNRAYYAFILAEGTGGTAVGGTYNNGWEGDDFTPDHIANPRLPASPRVAVNQGRPTISWENDPNATRHFLAIYSWTANQWVWGRYYTKSLDSQLTCNSMTCTVVDDAIMFPNGSYSAWINAEGPGGVTTGGLFGNGFNGPDEPNNPNEFGDFTINFEAPALVEGLGAVVTGNGTQVIVNFTGTSGATWYYLWLGTAGAAQTFYLQWHSSTALGCQNMGDCEITVTLPAPIVSGTEFYLAVMSAGPGGYSTGGPVGNGFAVSEAFTAP